MRNQHLRLHAIYTMIKKCDQLINIADENKLKYGDYFWTDTHQTLLKRYIAIREKLYSIYANQIVKINENVLRKELR
jgi:hypothetical protein